MNPEDDSSAPQREAEGSRHLAIVQTYFASLLAITAVGVVGLLSGYLVGHTGLNHPQVTGAVVPAVITGIVAGILWLVVKSTNIRIIVGSLSVLLFCGLFFLGGNLGVSERAKDNTNATNNARKLERQHHFDHLEWCSDIEYRINNLRNKASLPPLSSEYFCRQKR